MHIGSADRGLLKEVLGDALDLDSAARGAYLASLNLSPEMLVEVESVLNDCDDLDEFLTVDAAGYVPDLFAEEDLSDRVIGPYKITSPIGRGGMGKVYRAERIDGKFEQTVAVKFLRYGIASSELKAAFEREINIQSRLKHPSIASVLDTGILNDTPYVVMEFVEGVPIDSYCISNKLSLTSRLKLFIRVCEAVAFAHQKLVIHRDIKPANILVTEGGQVKLLDFGISELTGIGPGDETTENAIKAFTPGYSCPASVSGEPYSTTADIYSLGIVMRQLITQRNSPTAAAASDSVPTDLVSIVKKATATEPANRYVSVDTMAADIWRFIDGMPVISHPDSFGYRLSKLWTRNKFAVSAASLILISLALGFAVSAWQANVALAESSAANNARSAAEGSLVRAEEERRRSEKISKFMFRVLSYANPKWYAEGYRSGGEANVYQVMVEIAEKIDIEFAGEPDVASELHHRFAEVFLNKSETSAADLSNKHIARAFELRKAYYGERHQLVAKDMLYMYYNGIYDGRPAQEFLADAIAMMRETAPDDLNLAYMIEVVVAYVLNPDHEDIRAEFVSSQIGPQPGEGVWDWAERLSFEADRIFKVNYRERNSAIIGNDCRIALIQKNKGMHDPNSSYVQACRENKNPVPSAGK
jgi:hypothetical protein